MTTYDARGAHVTPLASDGTLWAARIASLYRLTDRLYRAHTAQEAYVAALDAIGEMMGTTRAAVLRFDQAGVMRFVASRGLSEAYCRAVEGHTPWPRGTRNARPLYVTDARDSDLDEAVKAHVAGEGIRALAFIPLAVDGEVVGKFMVYHAEPRGFSASERELAQAIARQLGFAMQRHATEDAARRLAALVESSDDAILGIDLTGRITSWNRGARLLFGYSADEIIGSPAARLIPPGCESEEDLILARIRQGERIEHCEVVRLRKDGTPVDVSLTVSPILDSDGHVVGASKIARDISERRIAQERQHLLMREMNHRIKNLFALASSMVRLSARSAETVDDLAWDLAERFSALARAHQLTMPAPVADGAAQPPPPTLEALFSAILAPYAARGAAPPRFTVAGGELGIDQRAVPTLALVLHELATNAAKHGAFSLPMGHVQIVCTPCPEGVHIDWRERGGPMVEPPIGSGGFGSDLLDIAASQLGGIVRTWHPDGLQAEITLRR